VERRRNGAPAATLASPALTRHTADEIDELLPLVQSAQLSYLVALHPQVLAADIARLAELLAEISAAVEHLFDDGVEDQRDAQLAQIKQAHQGDPATLDAAIAELADYAGLAQEYRAELDGFGGFQVADLDEALALVTKLRGRPQQATSSDESTLRRVARDQLVTLLWTRVKLIRSAAQYVFRGHPEIARRATSAYLRRQRALQRHRAAQRPASPASPAAPSTSTPG
jgi:hypothetical protein